MLNIKHTDMKTKHTKGTWKYFPNEKDDFTICTVDESSLLAIVGTEFPTEEAEANAKIIAAAPELLEALERVYNFLSPVSNVFKGRDTLEGQYMLSQMRCAIKKATE